MASSISKPDRHGVDMLLLSVVKEPYIPWYNPFYYNTYLELLQ